MIKMLLLFAGLTIFNFVCLLATLALGYAAASGRDLLGIHTLAGVLATIACCAVHCIVFTYFIATAKWIQHAILVKHLDPALATPTRSFKAQAFPAALAAMLSVFLAALFGAAVQSYGVSPHKHELVVYGALIVNALAAVFEYRAIRRNASLIDDILERIKLADAQEFAR